MISHGDGIAILGVCGVLITAIVRLTGGPAQPVTNGYVRTTTFKAVHDGLQKQLTSLGDNVKTLFSELKEINDYIRSQKR